MINLKEAERNWFITQNILWLESQQRITENGRYSLNRKGVFFDLGNRKLLFIGLVTQQVTVKIRSKTEPARFR